MKKIAIFYFSGTGNTWWAAGRLAEELKAVGHQAERISIEQPSDVISSKLMATELILLAYPVYGSDRPEIVKDFINNLPITSSAGKTAVDFGIICTQLAFSGDGAWLEYELIEKKGYRIKWAVHLKMPNNISIPGFPFKYSNDPGKLEKTIEKSARRIKIIADAVSEGRLMRQGTSSFSKVLGLMQRSPYRKMFPSFQNALSIDEAICTRCGQCISLCPAANISAVGNGFPEYSGKCILCLRCYNFCPESAVRYGGKNFKPKSGGRNVPYRGPVENFKPSVLKE